ERWLRRNVQSEATKGEMRMRRTMLALAAVFLLPRGSFGQGVEVEGSGAPVVVTPANEFTFYNTTGLTIVDPQSGQTYLYLYHQGAEVTDLTDSTNCPSQPEMNSPGSDDKIIAYRAPVT